jgi:hypothetical protein
MVTIYTTYFNALKLCILPTECIYVFRIILKLTATVFLNNINRLAFVAET